jgi:ATP-binding cassette subfamily D (ALD) long-chain fatty acid import protein
MSASKGLALRRVYDELRQHLSEAVNENVRQLFLSKPFYLCLIVSGAAASAMTAYEVTSLRSVYKTLRGQGSLGSWNKKQRKKHSKKKKGTRFRSKFLALLKLCFPKLVSRGGLLLLVQFILLVMRTLLTVKATKLNVYFLTKAITKASFAYWTKWLVSFAGWMCCGVSINASLRYFENLIALVMRKKLTTYVHGLYMKKNGFYRAIVLKDGNLDNVDARITADIDQLCSNCAVLYGHSFKPILEFTLTLYECVGFLGWQRPVALFSWNIVMDIFLRAISPRLGPLVAREQELEGDFRRAHARLIENAEEVAFLQGGPTENSILDARLTTLMDTKRLHGIARLKKDIGHQVFKFQGPMIGGVFVHIPFLLRNQLSEAGRIRYI